MNGLLVPTAQLDKSFVDNIVKQLNAQLAASGLLREQSDDYTVRDTLAFGYDYFALLEGDQAFTPIPAYLEKLCHACIEALGPGYQLGAAQDYSNVIVSIYREGYRLQPHVDVDPSENMNFYFGDQVIGVVLECDQAGRFYLVQGESEADTAGKPPLWTLAETPGMVFLLEGMARRKPYFHGVTRVNKLRISVTFRTVIFKLSNVKNNL